MQAEPTVNDHWFSLLFICWLNFRFVFGNKQSKLYPYQRSLAEPKVAG